MTDSQPACGVVHHRGLRLPKGLKLGDYCHCHKYAGKDPMDPFAVGFLSEVTIKVHGVYYRLQGADVPPGWWRYCHKVTREEGRDLLMRDGEWLRSHEADHRGVVSGSRH